jgi:hypothetical protein
MLTGYSNKTVNAARFCCKAVCVSDILYRNHINVLTQYINIKILMQNSNEYAKCLHSKQQHPFKICYFVAMFNEVYC